MPGYPPSILIYPDPLLHNVGVMARAIPDEKGWGRVRLNQAGVPAEISSRSIALFLHHFFLH